MGRYTQRMLRGGGPPPLPRLLTIERLGAAAARASFDRAVVADDGPPADTSLTINGNSSAVDGVTQLTATTVRLNVIGGVLPGQAWSLSGSPNWLSTPIQPAAAGLII